MKIKRKKTKAVYLGGLGVGGRNPVRIQSMTKTDTKDVESAVKQIHELEDMGCEIIRSAVPDAASASALKDIIKEIHIPLVADVHFDWRLAVKALYAGAAGIRINPGNIGGVKKVREIVSAARERNAPIRIGVNSGSLNRKYKSVTARSLVSSTMEYVRMVEDTGYRQIKISVKAADVWTTVDAYRMISRKTGYPLHIGVTEAGPLAESAVRSAIALGMLLAEGIGDTIRVSVTGRPHNEIIVAKEILQCLGIRRFGPDIISCPTCARCKVDLQGIVSRVKNALSHSVSGVGSIAVMGCVVNGPGEARNADIGVACGAGCGMLFKKGRQVKRIKEDAIVKELIYAME